MAKNTDKKTQRALVAQKIADQTPRMISKMFDFIDSHFDDEDKDYRRDAHKLAHKIFDSQIPKVSVIENHNETRIVDERLHTFINNVTSKKIEMADAEIINEEEAKEARAGL